jgi:hypothetical protein
MALLKKILKKVLSSLVAGSTMFVIAACYGPPAGYGSAGMWTIKAKTSGNKPVPGLRVSILEYVLNYTKPDTILTEYTDTAGIFSQWITTYHHNETVNYAALIQDIDGSLNEGAFRDTLIPKTDSDSSTVILNPQ